MSEATQTVAAGQLRAFVERVERVESDIAELNACKSDIYKELRGEGFDVKTVRKIVATRKIDEPVREEQDAMFDLYWTALNGAPSRVHVHEANHTPIPSQDGKTESEGLASAPVTEHEQARFPSQGALEAGPVAISSLGAGPADPFNDTGPHVFSDHESVA